MDQRTPKTLFTIIALGLCFFSAGCATTYVKPTALTNPPPKEKFSDFQHFEVKPISLPEKYASSEANQKALKKIQENWDIRVNPLIKAWSKDQSGGRTLAIAPEIVDIKFINATVRVWAGAFAGSSAVLMKVKFTDEKTGQVIADPQFYQRAAAMGGAWTFGSTDNNMLVRIARVATDYIKQNYSQAVGGPTGAKELPKKKD